MARAIVQLQKVHKSFGVVKALQDVSIEFHAATIHAILGENGAGKSTLVRLLAGVHRADRGTILVSGKQLVPQPAEAMRAGVATIHQDRALVPRRSISENLALGREVTRGPFLDSRRERRMAREALDTVGLQHPLHLEVGNLSAGDQQLVAIAKALIQEARVLILDEPTAALTEDEAQHLFSLVAEIKKAGLAIIYITHRLHEVEQLADAVTVLKDGRKEATLRADECSESQIVNLMIGRELGDMFPSLHPHQARQLLKVEGLSAQEGAFEDVSFVLRAGEIIGITGLEGSGKSELGAALVGALQRSKGNIELDGAEIHHKHVSKSLLGGIAYSPRDRLRQAVFPAMPLVQTITLSALHRVAKLGIVRLKKEIGLARNLVRALQIKGNLAYPMSSLSGGNQQKSVLARGLFTEARIFVLDEPTAGVDVGSRADIYQILVRLARDGAGILVISSDMIEILGLCHRVLVMVDGRIVSEFDHAEATEERIMRAQLAVDKASTSQIEVPIEVSGE